MADEQAARTTPTASDPPGPVAERKPSTAEKTIQLSVAYPVDKFETNISGVPALTQQPIAVAATHAKQIRTLADANGVTLIEGGSS